MDYSQVQGVRGIIQNHEQAAMALLRASSRGDGGNVRFVRRAVPYAKSLRQRSRLLFHSLQGQRRKREAVQT